MSLFKYMSLIEIRRLVLLLERSTDGRVQVTWSTSGRVQMTLFYKPCLIQMTICRLTNRIHYVKVCSNRNQALFFMFCDVTWPLAPSRPPAREGPGLRLGPGYIAEHEKPCLIPLSED